MKFSIIIPCLNSGSTIDSTLSSLSIQSYSDFECIVVDGGSNDTTLDIVGRYRDIVTECISEPDMGIYDAMNKGLSIASGDVIGILNSDDFYPDDSILSEVVRTFEGSPYVDMVLGNVDFVHPDNLTCPVRSYSSFNFKPWKMRFGFMPAHPASFIKRLAYEEVGRYQLGYKIAADFEWFVRAFLFHKLSYLKMNKTLVRMREGGVSTSGVQSYWVSTKEMLFAMRANNIYSNILFIMFRLPIKFLYKVFTKG